MSDATASMTPPDGSGDGAGQSGEGAAPLVSPALAEGRSRLALYAGMGGLAIGHVAGSGLLVWAGVAFLAAGFALNTLGKVVHYRSLAIPAADRAKLVASWVLLALTAVGLLATYAAARYGPGDGGYVWALAAGALGFGLLHMAAQSRYLPVDRRNE